MSIHPRVHGIVVHFAQVYGVQRLVLVALRRRLAHEHERRPLSPARPRCTLRAARCSRVLAPWTANSTALERKRQLLFHFPHTIAWLAVSWNDVHDLEQRVFRLLICVVAKLLQDVVSSLLRKPQVPMPTKYCGDFVEGSTLAERIRNVFLE
jgi:hypothetical protein